MSQAELENEGQAPEVELEGGTYEIIRRRLNGHGQELRQRLDQLNEARKDVFGSIETQLLATDRITTDHNCVPRDMVAIGKQFLFGYNVHFGLKTETDVSDVFAVYEFHDNKFRAVPLDLIADAQFERDFKEIYKYYKNAVFAKFFVKGAHIYMVFQVGKTPSDIKTLKWAHVGDEFRYLDNRSDHEVKYPPQHEFEWIRTHRDQHQSGPHPHISIDDRVFVETIGGDLTIKVEDNTDSGEGLYAEDVDHADQTLDDAEIYYALIGNIILLKIRPYQEKAFRYLVFNEKIQKVQRLDAIEDACVLLPDDHGLIFSNGYYLQTGEYKTFGNEPSDMLFERRIAAPNGEDYLYVFYNRRDGEHVLLPYNLIAQQVATPIICHGVAFFHGGEMVCFKSQGDPQKHHALQIWQTPYTGEDYVPTTDTESLLFKIGNRDLVRGMAECHEILSLLEKDDTYANLYVDLVKKTGGILDSFFWVDKDETYHLNEPLQQIKQTAASAIEEYEKVVRVRQNTQNETTRVTRETRAIIQDANHKRFDQIHDFVGSLGDLRRIRGDIISLKDLRYVDTPLVEKLEKEVAEQADRVAHRCVQFLLDARALDPYAKRVQEQAARIGELEKVTDAKALEEEIAESAAELEMLIEIVGNLKIDDATHRTTIIDNISAIFSGINQARATLKRQTKELLSVEGVAEFNSQMKLLNQGVVNYLDICDSPEKCDEFLTKVMIQIEELEGRFAEFDEFVLQLTEKREEIYNAFETRKLALVEARNRRANSLMKAADRILKGIRTRVENLESVNDINGYFASDLMIEKIRDLVGELQELEDTVKVDDIQSRLKTIREDAVRQLKDRQDLFVGGDNVIRFGKHQFSVNVQTLDLTTVLRDEEMCLHLTGTNFFEEIEDEQLLRTKPVWQQEVPSENREIYRGEYLAYRLFQDLQAGQLELKIEQLRHAEPEELAKLVQRYMGPRYNEAYSKGVHDHDASQILRALVEMNLSIGLLRYATQARALGAICWQHFAPEDARSLMSAKLKGFGAIAHLFPNTDAEAAYVRQLEAMLSAFVAEHEMFDMQLVREAAEYLFAELTRHETFAVSRRAAKLHDAFHDHLKHNNYQIQYEASVEGVKRHPASSIQLLRDWVYAFAERRDDPEDREYVDEVAAILARGKLDRQRIIDGDVSRVLTDMVGTHPILEGGQYKLNYNHFLHKLDRYELQVVPMFRNYIERKKEVVDEARDHMRLDEFRPRVLTSFVRNRLIDQVYLPLVGDNLAKQIGVVGEQKRTDRMGLLLLVSPPGYGKTTLMEYIANRLGIIFMKINGPAIGHQVTSLDPEEAPNAGAREEVEKLNLSLEMGDNVMIYLDDIQHCNPELLQKFISLCDAQRKIEGVYKGKTRTYDLRGRKVAVVMAGNPYTESGEKFQIPDMLSNRADIYNLGEIIGESREAFEMSYLENCLTSNPVLNKLASRSQKDVYAVIKMAETGEQEGIELEGNYSLEELNEMVSVMRKLLHVRDVVLKVNREYIRSAAQADEYRTEPAFKLQGSYRNMNRIAEKVVAIMNDEELESLLLSNYENDAQTLTSDTESNMLKLREMLGILTDEQRERWEDIKRTYRQNVKLKGVGSDDKVGQVIVQLSSFSDGLDSIRKAMAEGVQALGRGEATSEETRRNAEVLVEHLQGVRTGLEQIGQTLGSGLDEERLRKMLEQLRPATPPTIAGLPLEIPEPPTLGEEGEGADVEEAGAYLQPGTAAHKVTVQHKVPRSILKVLRSQFQLMESWMEPMYRASQGQQAELRKLQETLDGCLASYSQLLAELEAARSRQK